MSDLQTIPFATPDGRDATLGDYAGTVLLVVNVASKCGLTPQYEALEALYEARRDEGFAVLGFPANNFAGQEPGTDEEIAEFCSLNYSVTFPLFSKISVVGDDQHPLYGALTTEMPQAEGGEAFREVLRGYGTPPNEEPDVIWNFEKFLIGRDGKVAARFGPQITVDDPAVVAAIDAALAAG